MSPRGLASFPLRSEPEESEKKTALVDEIKEVVLQAEVKEINFQEKWNLYGVELIEKAKPFVKDEAEFLHLFQPKDQKATPSEARQYFKDLFDTQNYPLDEAKTSQASSPQTVSASSNYNEFIREISNKIIELSNLSEEAKKLSAYIEVLCHFNPKEAGELFQELLRREESCGKNWVLLFLQCQAPLPIDETQIGALICAATNDIQILNALFERADGKQLLLTARMRPNLVFAFAANANRRQTIFHLAAFDGKIVILKELVAKLKIFNPSTDYFNTTLHAAIEGLLYNIMIYSKPKLDDHLAVIEYLLSLGADVNALNVNGYSPLGLLVADETSISSKRIPHLKPALDLLLKHGAILAGAGEKAGESFLTKVALKSRFALIQDRPVTQALLSSSLNASETKILAPLKKEEKTRTEQTQGIITAKSFVEAIEEGRVDRFLHLLSDPVGQQLATHGIFEFTKAGRLPLLHGLISLLDKGGLDFIKILQKEKFALLFDALVSSRIKRNQTPLCYLFLRNKDKIISDKNVLSAAEILLSTSKCKKMADVLETEQGLTPLQICSQLPEGANLARLLLSAGASYISPKSWLDLLPSHKDLKINMAYWQIIIANCKNILNLRDFEERTILEIAASSNYFQLVELLLNSIESKEADVLLNHNFGEPPLTAAVASFTRAVSSNQGVGKEIAAFRTVSLIAAAKTARWDVHHPKYPTPLLFWLWQFKEDPTRPESCSSWAEAAQAPDKVISWHICQLKNKDDLLTEDGRARLERNFDIVFGSYEIAVEAEKRRARAMDSSVVSPVVAIGEVDRKKEGGDQDHVQNESLALPSIGSAAAPAIPPPTPAI